MKAEQIVDKLLEADSDVDPEAYALSTIEMMFDPTKVAKLMEAHGWVSVGCSLAYPDENCWLLEWNSPLELNMGMPEKEFTAEADRAVKDATKVVLRVCSRATGFEYLAPFTDGDFGLYFKLPPEIKPAATLSWEPRRS